MQHLNLYGQIDRQVEPPFSARQQARLVAVAAVVMIAAYLALLLGASGTESELKKITAQQKAVAQELQQLKEQKARLENNPELDREVAALERDVAFRRRLMNTIAPEGRAPQGNFAEHLSGLARQHIDGMWLTEIQLQQGGQQMALLGQTKEPEYVPQYLQKLSGEAVFEGHRFRVLRIHVPEDRKDLHAFELRAKEVGTP